MKKIICALLLVCLCMTATVFADTGMTDILLASAPQGEIPIKIISDNKIVETDTVVVNERTLIPLRALLESTGAEVGWDNPTQTASVTRDGKTIYITIGSNIMKTPAGNVTLDVSPILHEGTTTYAPLRAIAEEFGIKVEWDNGTKTILVTTPDGCPYVDFYDGLTLADFIATGAMTPEEFEEVSALDYDEYKDKPYVMSYNSIPFDTYAMANSLTSETLLSILELPADYPTDVAWGQALGDTTLGTYVINVIGFGNGELTKDEAVAIIRDLYGLGVEYTASTPFKFVRTIIDTIDLEVQKQAEEDAQNQMQEDLAKLPELTKNKIFFTITMQDGSKMEGELYPDLAPETVENFVNLVNDKFYDGLVFHRVIDGFMIQGGGYNKNLTPKEAPDTINGEFYANGVSNALSHEKGVISMARTNEYNSASSQFFIMDENNTSLDGNYAAFGRITEGLDVVEKISKSETETKDNGMTDVPVTPVIIKTIRITK